MTELQNKSGFDGTDKSLAEWLVKLPELKLLCREIEKISDLRAAEIKAAGEEPFEGVRFKAKRVYPVWSDERITDETRFDRIIEAGYDLKRGDLFKMIQPSSAKKLLDEGEVRKFMSEFSKPGEQKFTLESTEDPDKSE